MSPPAAPLPELVARARGGSADALGAPSPVPARAGAGLPSPERLPDGVLLATALAALVAEVASRRLRGER